MSYTLYSYWRSSASWRIRLALELKRIPYSLAPVNLVANGGEHRLAAFRDVNPMGLVPALQKGDWTLSQSLAICEYLEAAHPDNPLLPADLEQAAEVRAFCTSIACEIHPLNNLRVLGHLKEQLHQSPEQVEAWYIHWIQQTFAVLEQLASGPDFVFDNRPTLAECFLIPQIYNARRFHCPLEPFPKLVAIDTHCRELAEFVRAHPEQQPDCPEKSE